MLVSTVGTTMAYYTPTSPDGYLTICSICLEVLDNPRALPCLHTFCYKCLDDMWSSKQPDATVECPNCRAQCSLPAIGVAGFRHNFYIERIIEVEIAAKLQALQVKNWSKDVEEGEKNGNNDVRVESSVYDNPIIGPSTTPVAVRPPLPLPAETGSGLRTVPFLSASDRRQDVNGAEVEAVRGSGNSDVVDDSVYTEPEGYELPTSPPSAALQSRTGREFSQPPSRVLPSVSTRGTVGQIPLTAETLSKIVLKPTGINLVSDNRDVQQIKQKPIAKPKTVAITSLRTAAAESNNVTDVRQNPWFFETMDRSDCESKLLQVGKDGTFVVRTCQHAGRENPYALTLLYRSTVRHIKIRLTSNGKYALGSEKPDGKVFNTLKELITFHQSSPLLLTTDKQSLWTEWVLLDGTIPKP